MSRDQEIPAWARRIRRERQRRGWSQQDAVDRLVAHAHAAFDRQVPSSEHVLRRWKAWEAGENMPGDRYQGYIAATFGTVKHAVFPPSGQRADETGLLTGIGMDTLELIAKVRASDVDNATLGSLALVVDRLCSEYAFLPAERLVVEGREWLRRVAELRNGRLTLGQHREVLTLAGWLALLVGCVEYDSGDQLGAEATRRAALSLGEEAGHAEIQGWAHEMSAWFSLTTDDYRGVIAAARAGHESAADHGVAVQLAAQEAKAWAKIGDRRQAESALDKGRRLLDTMPFPANVRNHFVVDPGKYDYYAMNVLSLVGEDDQATGLADEVIRAGTEPDGVERSPCETPRHESHWVYQPPDPGTSNRRSPTGYAPSPPNADPCHTC